MPPKRKNGDKAVKFYQWKCCHDRDVWNPIKSQHCSHCGHGRCNKCQVKAFTSIPGPYRSIKRQGKCMDVLLKVHNIELYAIPDTGSDINAIPLSTLKDLSFPVEKLEEGSCCVKAANGDCIKALHRVQLCCQLIETSGDTTEIKAEFHVFEKLANKVVAVLGRHTLEQMEILTRRTHLLWERQQTTEAIPRCMSFGLKGAYQLGMKVRLGRHLVRAIADTGSEINLVSTMFAFSKGLSIYMLSDEDNIEQVEFVHGRTARIRGKTVFFSIVPVVNNPQDISNSFADLSISEESLQSGDCGSLEMRKSLSTFYVVDALVHDVILSQALLHSLDVFGSKSASLEVVPLGTNADGPEFCTIFKMEKKVSRPETYLERKQREAARTAKVKSRRRELQEELRQSSVDPAVETRRKQELENLNKQDRCDRARYEMDIKAMS